jgi:hypothetical protein
MGAEAVARWVIAAVAALGAVAPTASAQGRLSEKASVTQTVAGTTLTVEYYRPVARGREKLFGGVVSWGEHWTPGANWAATVEVNHDVRVEGQFLPKGKYGLWAVVRPDSWTVELHREWHRFHTNRPDSTDEALRLTVRPDSGPHTEVLTFDFPEMSSTATTLRLRWGTVVVPLHVSAIPPPLALSPSSAERAPYLGRYDLTILPAAVALGAEPGHFQVEIRATGDTLQWRDLNRPKKNRSFVLSPLAEDEFRRSWRDSTGAWWEEPGVVVSFDVQEGRATGFEVQFESGTVASRATRVR